MCAYKKEISGKGFYINILLGAGIGFGITLLMLLLMAVLMLATGINTNMASPLASVALAAGSAMGSYIAAFRNKQKGFVCALLIAAIIFAGITLVALIISREFSLMSLIHLVVVVLSSLIGGILGVNKSDKVKIV